VSVGEFREPPSPAEWTNTVRSQSPTLQQSLEPLDQFITAVDSSVRAATCPLKSSTPSGAWLSALIQMEGVRFARAWHGAVHGMATPLTTFSLQHSSLESYRRVIMAFEERIPAIRCSDYALSFSRLGLLSEKVKSRKTQLEEELNNEYRITSVQEARNAVSCESLNPRASDRKRRALTRPA
jgi:hypothetical protein